MESQRSKDIEKIYQLMQSYSLTAGNIIMKYRGKVVGKEKPKGLVGGDQAKGGLYVTDIDMEVQELFLERLFSLNKGVRINCEEETEKKEWFKGNSGITVHQDPLDGTTSYLEGKEEFATGYGISDPENNFTHTVIYVPVRDRLYIASPEENRVLNGKLEKIEEEIKPNYRIIFTKRALNDKGREQTRKAGFETYDIESAHCRIIDVALRKAGAYLYGQANPHDSLIPYAFANARGLTLTNSKGGNIEVVVNEVDGLPKFERVPSVVYITRENPHENTLREILSDKSNLDEKFVN